MKNVSRLLPLRTRGRNGTGAVGQSGHLRDSVRSHGTRVVDYHRKAAKEGDRHRIPVRIAIVGTGGMAQYHAERYAEIPGCSVVAAVDVDRGRVETFSRRYGITRAYTSLDGLLASGTEFDAVSIVTPDAFHGTLSIQSLRAGKHVLCEKPLAMSFAEAQRMVAAAKEARRVAMVHFSYRRWPCIHGVREAIRNGEIGEVRHVEASYLQGWLSHRKWGDWRTTPTWLWRLSSRHGSRGALCDLGVHIIDFATFPVGPIQSVFCNLKTFPKARRGRIGAYVFDVNDSAVINVEFLNGALGTIHTTRWAAGDTDRLYLKISGTKGAVEIDSDRMTDAYRICSGLDLDCTRWREVKAMPVAPLPHRFIDSIQTGAKADPDFARGAEVQEVLDACFESNARRRPVLLTWSGQRRPARSPLRTKVLD